MNAMSLSQWILAATIVAAVFAVVALARWVNRDGFGTSPAPDPRRDWGTSTLPSTPYAYREYRR